jgi:putative ABC transport system permease protein
MDRPGVVSEFQVAADNSVRSDADLKDICRQIEGLRDDAHQPLGLKAQSTHDFVKSATEAKLGNAMAWATSAIVIALSTMGILNTMLMSVLDRTRELGILRAVGWTRARIVRLILGETCAISLIGAVLGSSVAWATIRLLSHWPATSLLVSTGLSASALGLGFAVAIATGIAGSLYPALHAANVPPIESLRHE